MSTHDDFLWCEKYRPKTVSETILPERLKKPFAQYVKQENLPNLLLTGGPGIGKTTIAKAMLNELDADYIIINGSMSGNIDTLRNDIKMFASTSSLMGGRKYVILDEADYLNSQSTQPALRNFMEEFSKNCGFILTCNYPMKIIKELHSRCSVIDFDIQPSEKKELTIEFFKRICMILETEGVEYDKKVLAGVVKKYHPDWRRCINQLQHYSATGKIDSGILTNLQDTNIKVLIQLLKDKNFTEIRKWVTDNPDLDFNNLCSVLYKNADVYIQKKSIPNLVLHIDDYDYRAAFVINKEIHSVAFLIEVMISCEFI